MSFAAPDLRSPVGHKKRYAGEFAQDVIAGLSAPRKTIPSKYFYDARGSELFEMICAVDEYYPTRTEMALLQTIAPDIAQSLPAQSTLVEFGSGASAKTRLLLDVMKGLDAYIPIDISETALAGAVQSLQADYPSLPVRPIHADFTAPLYLPDHKRQTCQVGFFPGSTIGNFTQAEAVHFMGNARALLGDGSYFILGADLIKDTETLIRAYDDAEGVTAAFNLNLLVRVNQELDGDADLRAFSHRAIWNEEHSRIEMHLVSEADQTIQAAGRRFYFTEGETIHTENCHKFSKASLSMIASQSGWRMERYWQSEAPEFAVVLLRAV